jgi:hypothetical protein
VLVLVLLLLLLFVCHRLAQQSLVLVLLLLLVLVLVLLVLLVLVILVISARQRHPAACKHTHMSASIGWQCRSGVTRGMVQQPTKRLFSVKPQQESSACCAC